MKVAMPRWLKVVRGMVGTGLTFAVGVGAGGGVLDFLLSATNEWNVWSPMGALGNLALLAVIGGGSAAERMRRD